MATLADIAIPLRANSALSRRREEFTTVHLERRADAGTLVLRMDGYRCEAIRRELRLRLIQRHPAECDVAHDIAADLRNKES